MTNQLKAALEARQAERAGAQVITLVGEVQGGAPDVGTADKPVLTPPVVGAGEGPPTQEEIGTAVKAGDAARKDSGAVVRALVTRQLNVFMDQHGALRCDVPRNGGRVDSPHTDAEEVADFVRQLLRAADHRSTASPAAIEALLAEARSRARTQGHIKKVHIRLAGDGAGGIRIDTANARGEVICVSAGGYGLEPQGDVRFHRGSGVGELPEPEQMDAATAYSVLSTFLKGAGVPAADLHVLVIALLEHARPGTPTPIVEMIGRAGSGKTTLARSLISIVDPCPGGDIPVTDPTEPGIMAAALNRHALFVDNQSRMSSAESDLWCRVSTGTTISARRLYSQREIEAVHVQRPVVFTSITTVGHRSDLRTRMLSVRLNPPSGSYLGEQGLRAAFTAEHPRLLGAVCALLSAGLAGLPAVSRQGGFKHRLVDFEQLGEAIHQSLGRAVGWFGQLLTDRRRVDAEALAEADPLIAAVLKVAEGWLADPKCQVFTKPGGRQMASGGVHVWHDGGAEHVGAVFSEWLAAVKRAMPYGENEQSPANVQALANAIEHRGPTFAALGFPAVARPVHNRKGLFLSRKRV